ncbi:MAG: bifunctional adenosylcobinamide kinase/adenosylcobinamide-phosphate guanylyltransferase [Oscillospiraceae bacterium]|nr:bifunctional adenosylcobinamide kinase/adenosylcobinamide-phosphate guanylyltransferase [Oscillospiraceae bacterium]
MILIIGGAYQGKLDFAKKTFGLEDGDVFHCAGGEIDFTGKCIVGLERFVYGCVERGVSAAEYFRARREAWRDSILICEDINCGVVPLGAEARAWREETGRLCVYLAGEAERVSRIFCGLEQRLK